MGAVPFIEPPLTITRSEYRVLIAPGFLVDALRALEWGDDDPAAVRGIEQLVAAIREAE